ncbi:hypothetical protein UMM65_11195 [Aureibaculum sp. 2210JD6-5]|uniref:hypothetical protein n=1 Tax=Aureibaculum sp. 2210JD6-5 TaxID=3103957 RepID=UPI002AAD279E|nr:hypothetical protein [Aureibaculum sp. 2210JD6-5]MDY7395812.1 hypothetical protein [Aureibaculum sp. 2210JD6-5]
MSKIVPKIIEKKVNKALSFYPKLTETRIEFRIKENIKKSTMQAQPKWDFIWKSRKNRAYIILISNKFKIEDQEFNTLDIPSDVFIGWIGHELGHIMDYENKNKLSLILFGIKYFFSEKSIKEAERMADTFAVNHGMANYILATKDFILNHASITQKYKSRIIKYYLSPEEIMELVEEQG